MREVLSFVMSVYDPMGLISNLTIHGRILMQELHKESSSWDAEISHHLLKQWEQWIEIIKQASNIKIPRWILCNQAQRFEIHTFVDASEYAFAAALYIRGINALGQTVSMRLMAAKARVAPVRKLSIPRLELQAAVLGNRLAKTIQQELRKQPARLIFWSDSQTVLSWIHSDHRKYTQFVAHRVGEILETTKMDQWRYVPTDVNPADEGTKEVKGTSKWLTGPAFIWKSEGEWPTSKFDRNTEEEKKNVVMIHSYDNIDFDFIQEHRYSNWNKLVKHVCFLKKFTDWIKNKSNFNKNITYEDKKAAERAIIRKAQWEGFTKEMEDLAKNGDLTKASELSAAVPGLNQHGVMVSRSRLQQTNIVPLSARQPAILPYKHHITRLIMKMYHEKYLHQGDNVVIGAVHQKYWIVRSRQVLQHVKANCQKCKIKKASPVLPQMAVLPKCRLNIYGDPFAHTGVDYFGPIEVQVKRSIEKRWGVIFTCLTTRAAYIELAERLDTDAFLMCLKNFQHRRGKVEHLYSDNGTNFVGAEREMREAVQEISEQMGKEKAAAIDIQWSFNPPVAPHFGGAWERLIRIIKKCLYEMPKARGHHKPTPEELRSALIQAEFILNSRPLTHIPIENIDDEPLTPFHFINGRAGEYASPYSLKVDGASREHYKRVQHYAQYFWERWRKEYLPTILKRNKWTKKVEPIKEGDVVIITDKETMPGSWLKGRVIKVNTAADGQVRSAEIKTIQGVYTRAAAKIAVLDIAGENDKINDPEPLFINLHKEIGKISLKASEKKTNITKERVPRPKGEIHFVNHHREAVAKQSRLAKTSRKRTLEHPEEKIKMTKETPDVSAAKVNFDSWGNRCKIDINKIKELRDQLNSRQPARKIMKTSRISAPWYIVILMFLYTITLAFGIQPSGLVAYDCANPDVNMTSYSLLDVTSCLPASRNLSISEVPIQVLQRNAKSTSMVYQCKMIIKRSIRHCGMHSHTSDYERGYSYMVKEFTPEECRRIQISGTIPLTLSNGLHGIKRNQTTRGETLVVGSVWSSSCSGGVYKTPEYTWINALVYYEYEIALYNYMATVDNENDQILLRHGLVCPYSHGKCLDSEDGYSTWDISMNQRCEDTDFEVIYEGTVNKTVNLDDSKSKQHAVYTSISDSHLFSIRTKAASKICGYNGYNTDHPRIFILEVAEFKSPFIRRPSNVKNHDIFTYFNSKITLVENYVGQRLDDVYSTVMTEMCKLDKALLETKLTLARINPTEFVNSIMKRTGFSAVVAGEVLHVLECKPVYVQPFASERCYQELPVKYGNTTMFLTPVTRTLQTRGTEIECTPLLPAKFKFGGRWYTFDGKIRETTSPQNLATDIVTTWTYTPLPNLMESGVYDADSLQKMRTMIYDRGDQRIAYNVVHKILTGQNPSRQGFHFEALMSENVVDNMIQKYWDKLMTWSTWLGNLTSTAIGLYMIGRLFKFVVDTLMHGRILYDIYGFGWQLIASFWDSMTSFLTHRNTLRNINKSAPGSYEGQRDPAEMLPHAEGQVHHPVALSRGPQYPHIIISQTQ